MFNLSGKRFSVPLAVLAAATCAIANQSLVLFPGVTAQMTVPAAAPFTTLGATRLELRLNRRATPTSNAFIFDHPALKVMLQPNGEICAIEYMDPMPGWGNMMCADVTGQPDIVLRVQRDVANRQFQMEVHSAGNDWTGTAYCGTKLYGTQGNVFPCPMDSVNLSSWAGTATLGGTLTNVQIAWLKWYGSVVAPGSGSFMETTSADLADFRFEGNFTNQGTSGVAVALGPLRSSPASGGSLPGVIFAPSASRPPACNAGPQQVFRAGFPATLDGSLSYPLDGGTALQYAWQQLSGPSTAQWTNASTAQPGVTGLVFGSYVFQLTVTDGMSQSTACTVKHGAVATDNNGVVITGNASVDALLGPQTRFGANPWPWFDDRHRAAANVQIADLDPYYSSYWDTPAAGTIAVTANSATVTGAGTTFTTTFCQGPGNPTKPKIVNGDPVGLLVWYPAGAGQTGRRGANVVSCQSDTSLTLSSAWSTDVAAGSNLNYSYCDDYTTTNWLMNASPANFYDNVAAFYSLYYRSGLDDYLNAARKLADRFWVSPRIDRGASCGPNSPGLCTFPRNLSVQGLALRALDGRPDMWPGLHLLWDKFMSYDLGALDPNQTSIWDLREEAYHLAMVSYCALVDSDATYRSKCKTAVSTSFTNVWTPFKTADGSWAQLYYGGGGGSPGYASWDTRSSVTLTNGSTAVTGNGTSWNSGIVPATCMDGVSGGCPIWFTNTPGVRPPNNAAGDNTTYLATYVDATHITLDRPYQGTSGVHGWAITNSSNAGLLGWGAQPYMMGIMAQAFDFAARAVADTDPATSALAHSYNVTAANWIKTYGYWPLRKALYYGAQFVNCQAPISDTNPYCTANNGVSAARTLSSEVIRGVGAAYAYSGDSSLLAFGDTLYSAMFSKPNTGGPNPDGGYVSDWDDTIGWYMASTPPTGKAPKYFGMFFGFGGGSTWPAFRQNNTPTQTIMSTAYVPLHSGGPTRVHILVAEPSGNVKELECGAGPCAVPFDPRQGSHPVTLQYLGPDGKLLFTEQTVINQTIK